MARDEPPLSLWHTPQAKAQGVCTPAAAAPEPAAAGGAGSSEPAPEIVRVTVVHHAGAKQHSMFTDVSVQMSTIQSMHLFSIEEDLPANRAKDMHSGGKLGDRPELGLVTGLQQVKKGGFAVRVGDPDNLTERFFPVRMRPPAQLHLELVARAQ